MKQRVVMEFSKVERCRRLIFVKEKKRIKVVMERKEKTPVLLDVWLHVFVVASLNRYLNLSEKQQSARP
jgi:hypothetical protein